MEKQLHPLTEKLYKILIEKHPLSFKKDGREMDRINNLIEDYLK